jgi:hypothetical protein
MPLRALKAPDFTRVMPAVRNAIRAALLYWTAGRMSRKFSKLLPVLRKRPVVERVKGIEPWATSRCSANHTANDHGGSGFLLDAHENEPTCAQSSGATECAGWPVVTCGSKDASAMPCRSDPPASSSSSKSHSLVRPAHASILPSRLPNHAAAARRFLGRLTPDVPFELMGDSRGGRGQDQSRGDPDGDGPSGALDR